MSLQYWSELVQLVLMLGLPLAVGWLAFQGPLLALATQRGYLRTLGGRLPQALVNRSLRTCSIFPSPGWTMGTLWAIVVLGTLLGGLLLFIYEPWAVRRGLQAWRVLASREGQVLSPSWRMLWWWILLSYVALLGGLLASVILQQLSSA